MAGWLIAFLKSQFSQFKIALIYMVKQNKEQQAQAALYFWYPSTLQRLSAKTQRKPIVSLRNFCRANMGGADRSRSRVPRGRGKGKGGKGKGQSKGAGEGKGIGQGKGDQAVSCITGVDLTAACPNQTQADHADNRLQVQRLIAFLKAKASGYTFQQERGEGGYLHLQVRMKLYSKQRVTTVNAEYEKVGVVTKADGTKLSVRFSPTSAGVHADGNFNYVMKSDTRIRGPWTSKSCSLPWQIRPLVANGLYPWQEEVENSHSWPNPRDINVLIDPPGHMGKSCYTTWAMWARTAVALPAFRTAADLTQAAYALLKGKERTKLLLDLPRALTDIHLADLDRITKGGKAKGPPNFLLEKKMQNLREIFMAIEQIKNGVLSDPRHHFRQSIIPSPTIWVFCNHHLPPNVLSLDRWKVFHPMDGDCTRFHPKADGTPWYPSRDHVPEDAHDDWHNIDHDVLDLPFAIADDEGAEEYAEEVPEDGAGELPDAFPDDFGEEGAHHDMDEVHDP